MGNVDPMGWWWKYNRQEGKTVSKRTLPETQGMCHSSLHTRRISGTSLLPAGKRYLRGSQSWWLPNQCQRGALCMLFIYATIKLVSRTIEQTLQWLKEESGCHAMITHVGLEVLLYWSLLKYLLFPKCHYLQFLYVGLLNSDCIEKLSALAHD